jgi:hypothetical protein
MLFITVKYSIDSYNGVALISTCVQAQGLNGPITSIEKLFASAASGSVESSSPASSTERATLRQMLVLYFSDAGTDIDAHSGGAGVDTLPLATMDSQVTQHNESCDRGVEVLQAQSQRRGGWGPDGFIRFGTKHLYFYVS